MTETDIERSGRLPEVAEMVRRAVREAYPLVSFGEIFVLPCISPYGDEMVDVWAVYPDRDRANVPASGRTPLRARIWDSLYDMGLDAMPNLHIAPESDFGDWRPT